ncbi:hypothetical protein [Mesorhizobium helmanticense]|uniref:Uncharacterized protein n=1 Tax=Mesorhizobium helmanticense TaxID=1776423 RepID=A0A2T4J0U2_9HYPH|nr:hypothetical protein [Mesorhizobium helmanticense]PTE11531.1 hypothetical protein C9427_04735 [Mesorhizobium helmanticense]
MSRFIPQGDMTAGQIIDTSYDLLAILRVAEYAARKLQDEPSQDVVHSLPNLLALAIELHAPMHDALESHEGKIGGAS